MRKRTNPVFVVIFVLFIPLCTSAQEAIKNYVKNNTAQVKSASLNATDWSDLEALGAAISDARVVMLGEQDHGDAACMAAKSRIIRYLHEKKGFNVLAMEASFWGLNYGYEGISTDSLYRKQLKQMYPFWTYCDAANPFFYSYIPSTHRSPNPLRLAGLDNKASFRQSWPACEAALKAAGIPFLNSPAYTDELLPAWEQWLKDKKDTALTAKILRLLNTMRDQVAAHLGKNNFWVYYLDNQVSTVKDLGTDLQYWDKANQRDQQMAVNLRWLLDEKYKNEKIIVWAANVHISKYAGHYPNRILNPMTSMGTYFCRDTTWEGKTYILGFTAHHGTAGRLYPPTFLEIPKLEKNSYENWVTPGYDYAFTDFRKYNSSSKEDEVFFLSGAIRTTQVHKSDKALWNKVFDGIFFIREMYRCKEMKTD